MSIKALVPHKVKYLYRDYQLTDMSQPYINVGDLVLVQDMEYLIEQGAKSETIHTLADHLCHIVQVYKVDDDLWQYTVVGADGKDYILIDDDIKYVYKPTTVDT